MASYTFNRTGAEIEGILNHAANEWTVVEDITLEAAENVHNRADLDYSEVMIYVEGFVPASSGENLAFTINENARLNAWFNASFRYGCCKARALATGSGCVLDMMGAANVYATMSPTYMRIVSDADNDRIKRIRIAGGSGTPLPAGCKIQILGRV